MRSENQVHRGSYRNRHAALVNDRTVALGRSESRTLSDGTKTYSPMIRLDIEYRVIVLRSMGGVLPPSLNGDKV